MRLAIVEDNTLMRENLSLFFEGEPEVNLVGGFADAEEALCALPSCNPDVMLVDLGLPGLSGIELTKLVKDRMPDVDIMVYTVAADRQSVFAALKAGASGYILKGCEPGELLRSLHELRAGGAPMSPRIARRVIQEFQEHAIEESYLLTHREKVILMHLDRGLSYKAVSDTLNISVHTVHTHIKKIYEKLHAKDRRGALVMARRKGIL